MNIGFIVFAAVEILIVMWWMIKTRYGARAFALSALQGIAAIFAVNLAGTVTGVMIPVNWYTLGIGFFAGLPGVISTLLADVILR